MPADQGKHVAIFVPGARRLVQEQNRPAFAGDSDVDACPRRRNETAFNNGMAIGHQRSSSEVLARQLNDAKTFRLLTLPFDLPPVQIMVHTHSRFASDMGINWLRDTLVTMFAKRA